MTESSPKSVRRVALVCFVALLFCTLAIPAFADMVQLGYRQLRGEDPAPVAAQTTIGVIQSASWATPINPLKTNANQKIAAFAKGTMAGGTCTLAVGLYHKEPNSDTYTFLGLSKVQQVTLAATTAAQEAAAGVFSGTTDLDADTRAADYYDLRVTQIAAGNVVTVIHYPYGAGPRPGE